jgi:catechol-2,3-dioxygenase
MPFVFREQHDFDLHIALEVPYPHMEAMLAKGRAQGMETRGISDHGFIHSIYFRDPNGYVIELTARMPGHALATDGTVNGAREKLDAWQRSKPSTTQTIPTRSAMGPGVNPTVPGDRQ